MSVSLFPSGEPLRVSLKAGWSASRTGALIGFVTKMSKDALVVFGLIVLENGLVQPFALDEFTVDWRYDAEHDRWIDVNAERSGETDQQM